MVDYLLVFIRDLNIIIELFKEINQHGLKGAGFQEYYSGAGEEYDSKREFQKISAKIYIKTVCNKIETLFDIKLNNYESPMETENHPDIYESELLCQGKQLQYKMLINSAQYAVTLVQYDVQYTTNTLVTFLQKL